MKKREAISSSLFRLLGRISSGKGACKFEKEKPRFKKIGCSDQTFLCFLILENFFFLSPNDTTNYEFKHHNEAKRQE